MKYLLALLALVSSSVFATPCLTPGVQLNTFQMTMEDNTAHFGGMVWVGGTNECTVSFDYNVQTDFDFGDGQTLHNVIYVQDHQYPVGSFLATETRTVTVNYLSPNFITCNGSNQSDCSPYPHSYTDVTTHLFDITVASHMPEPSTYAMLLAGLGLLIRRSAHSRAAAPSVVNS